MNHLKNISYIIFFVALVIITASTIWGEANRPRHTYVPEPQRTLTKEQLEEKRRRDQLMWIIMAS